MLKLTFSLEIEMWWVNWNTSEDRRAVFLIYKITLCGLISGVDK